MCPLVDKDALIAGVKASQENRDAHCSTDSPSSSATACSSALPVSSSMGDPPCMNPNQHRRHPNQVTFLQASISSCGKENLCLSSAYVTQSLLVHFTPTRTHMQLADDRTS